MPPPHPAPHRLHHVGLHRHLSQPRAPIPRLPPPVRLRPLHPLRPFPGDHPHRRPPQHVPLQHRPQVAPLLRRRRVQHVEQRREEEERLPEPRREEGRAVGAVHHGLDEHRRAHVADAAEDRVPRARVVEHAALVHQGAQAEHVVHDDRRLVVVDADDVLGGDRLPPRRRHGAELEWEPERARAVAEPAPRPLEPSGWPETWLRVADERHPHLRWPAFPLRQPLQQGWPLEAVVLTAVVHDVHLAPPFRRAEDGHVGERERHPLEAARRHEHLVRFQQLHGRRALLRGREQPVLQARRAGQPRLQAVGEVMRQPLGGVPCRRRVPLDLLQEFAGAPAVARCHRLRARHEQLAQVHHLPLALPPLPPRRLPAVFLRGDAWRVHLLVPVEHHLLQHLADAIVVVVLLLRRGHQFARPAHLGLQLVPAMLTTLPSPTIAAPLHHQGSRILHGCTVHLTGDAGGGGEDLGERLLRLEESGVVGVQAEEHVVVDVLLHENTRDVREHHIVGRRGGFGRRRGWPHELQQRSAPRKHELLSSPECHMMY
ncbi:Os12g0136300 [Oryza sativa Japonica Group]|uniref:Os12g0136300 protein n=2 Tax=Oryza sativa subsp. japonica TaxID=39947 RepID=Q0IQ93_ORYSJ|nr:hypothetical protein EE612_057653 [Oryza sativa]BAF29122.1 Os12g0136300 [Oryza sativa Japonica Group]BAT15801.1 Os12g0136300 [Oryza sativa Japonica Group]|eukprot:NP_001066103.1 Os12g0136300 [Oryza sativa Japonica Group]